MADIIQFPGVESERMVFTCPDCGSTEWIVDIHLTLICSHCQCACHALESITQYLGIEYTELDFS